MLAGEQVDGLQALDELVEKRAEDELSLALGLLVLYEAFGAGSRLRTPTRIARGCCGSPTPIARAAAPRSR